MEPEKKCAWKTNIIFQVPYQKFVSVQAKFTNCTRQFDLSPGPAPGCSNARRWVRMFSTMKSKKTSGMGKSKNGKYIRLGINRALRKIPKSKVRKVIFNLIFPMFFTYHCPPFWLSVLSCWLKYCREWPFFLVDFGKGPVYFVGNH